MFDEATLLALKIRDDVDALPLNVVERASVSTAQAGFFAFTVPQVRVHPATTPEPTVIVPL